MAAYFVHDPPQNSCQLTQEPDVAKPESEDVDAASSTSTDPSKDRDANCTSGETAEGFPEQAR